MFIDSRGNSWIAISEFQSQNYCELQLKYKWEGYKPETKEMKRGSEIHEKKEKEYLEEAEKKEKLTIIEAVQRATKDKESFVTREFPITSPFFRLYGKIDSVTIEPDKIIVSDDKPTDVVFLSEKMQVLCYAIALKDKYRIPLELHVQIKNRDSGKVVWTEVVTQEHVEELRNTIQRLHSLATKKEDFIQTTNPKKCLKCPYREICDKRLA